MYLLTYLLTYLKRYVESKSRYEPNRVLSQYSVTISSLYCGIITGVETGWTYCKSTTTKNRWEFFPIKDGSFPFPSTVFPIPSHSHSQTGVLFPFPWNYHGISMGIRNSILMAISSSRVQRGPGRRFFCCLFVRRICETICRG